MEVLTNNPNQTKKLGEVLGKEISKTQLKNQALVLGLKGDLGGGKTTFLQGLALGLKIKEKILSPTFVILKKFEIKNIHYPRTEKFKYFYHLDCYRIQKLKEILNLDFKKIVSNPKNIVAVEWADKIRKIMPKNTIWIEFEFVDIKKRKIIMKSYG